MSPKKRTFPRIDSFLSRIRPIAPNAPPPGSAEIPAPGAWQDFFKGIERGEKIGFLFDREKVISLAETRQPPPENAFSMPLTASGKTIGVLQAAGNEAGWTAQEIEIVSAVGTQLAQHIEDLRRSEQNEQPAGK
jgi:hypothetical protein